MSKILLKKISASDVETPATGYGIMFVDDADGKVKVKFDDGNTKGVIFEGAGAPVDKNFVQTFTSSDNIVVNHSLGKIPDVTVIDSTTGKKVLGVEITYDLGDLNNKLTVSLTEPITGYVICN